MKQKYDLLNVETRGPGLYAFTQSALKFIRDAGINDGLLTCFIRHTSASLLIQENADPDVLSDLEDFMRRVVSRDAILYRHNAEGPDDMPSHIRAALTSSSVAVPVLDGKLALGTWQGLYVFEHRDLPRFREVLLHVMGE